MTHKFAKQFLFAVGAVALTAMAANATSCDSGTVLVNAPPAGTPATTCSLGSLTFTWESLSYSPSSGTLDIITPATGIYGSDYVLDFQFSGSGGTDVKMTYEVQDTAGVNISQVDSSFLATADDTPPASIQEVVCSVDPFAPANLGACPRADVLATYNNTSGDLTFSDTFGPEGTIWIIKDIQTGGPVAISGFTDSVVATPEPSSIGLLLIAAFGIVATARKLRKA